LTFKNPTDFKNIGNKKNSHDYKNTNSFFSLVEKHDRKLYFPLFVTSKAKKTLGVFFLPLHCLSFAI